MIKLVISALVIGVAGGVASADPVISNLPGNDLTQTAGINGTTRTKGMGFAMPAGTDYFLDDVVARLNITDLTVRPVFEVFSDAGGSPGAWLTTLANPAITSLGIANYSFTPSGSFTLVGGTSYWIIASSANATYDWKANSPSITPTGIATHIGATFGSYVPSSPSSILVSYQINGTVVPAPGAFAVLSFGGLLAARRRRA